MEDMDAFRRGYIQLFDKAFAQNGLVDQVQQGHIDNWFARYGHIAGALAGSPTPKYTFSTTDRESNRRMAMNLYDFGLVGYMHIKEVLRKQH